MAVDHKHENYNKYFPKWEKVRDVVGGQEQIKGKTTQYLPMLSGQHQDDYDKYLSRAQFVNFTGRTLNTSLGQLFRKNPLIDGIDEVLLDNIDLGGMDFLYFSKGIARELLMTNRVGVLVDYSDEAGRPFLVEYKAENIINWRTAKVKGANKLVMVILEGFIDQPDRDDPYKTKAVPMWLELYLENGMYMSRKWIKEKNNVGEDEIKILEGSEQLPLVNGRTLNFIPFYFLTSLGVTAEIYNAPLLDFANLNLGHYVNSADFENMLHWTGAKTIITKQWGDKPFPVGGAPDFPADGDAKFLEASSDSGLKDELKHKEEQMAVMGSSLLSGKGRYVASAETSRLTSEGEFATLADVSNSLSYSFKQIFSFMNKWAGVEKDADVSFNTDFETADFNPQEIVPLMSAVQSGYLSRDTFFYLLKNKEVYPQTRTLEEEMKLIDADTEVQLARNEKLYPALAMANETPVDDNDDDDKQPEQLK